MFAIKRDSVFLTFAKDAMRKSPYDVFCAQNHIHAFADLPILLFQNFKHKEAFDKWITTNAFIPEPLKTYMFDIFVSAARKHNAIRRFITRIARSRRISQTMLDLSMEPFGSASTYIDVFDNGKKYRFKISDMLNHIHSSLTHAEGFICSPVPIKNPYTGLPFSKPTMYSIYLLLNESRYAVPALFSLFVSVGFNIRRFEVQHEPMLRDHVIKAYIANMSIEKRREETLDMFDAIQVFNTLKNKNEPIIRVQSSTPEEMDQFSKWLHLYFVYLYSLNVHYSHVAHRSLVNEMTSFRKKNPMFGAAKLKRWNLRVI